jgi:uncharacterized protein YabE (DUF348 family)
MSKSNNKPLNERPRSLDHYRKVKLNDLPAGQYQLKVWYYATTKENLITEQNLNVKGSESANFKLETRTK